MEKVKTLRVYNLLDANGNKLRLRLGYTVDTNGAPCNGNAGWRWSFEGKNIPMPVRSRTWFCGFPEHTMISWLKGNGWYVQTRVDMGCGYAEVYELPNGNEEYNNIDSQDEAAVMQAIRLLYNNGNRIKAMHLYHLVYGVTLTDAWNAVREIIDQQA